MEFCVFTEPQQGADYASQLSLALDAEKLGFDGYFRSDHYLTMGGDGLPGPTDAWLTLAGLARETSRIRLGTLVSSATFRWPGILAIQVAQVDAMSGGRVELGLGTGWFEAEHRAYGIRFPARRFGRFEEQLQIVTGLWSTPIGETFSFDGEHYSLQDAPGLPKPVQSSVPIIIGGDGPKRTPALAARYASEYNTGFDSLEANASRFDRVRAACREAGRAPGTLRYSMVAAGVAVGATAAQAKGRAEAIGKTPEELRRVGLFGTVTEVVDRLAAMQAVGTDRVYLQYLDMADRDQLDLIAREILPQLGWRGGASHLERP